MLLVKFPLGGREKAKTAAAPSGQQDEEGSLASAFYDRVQMYVNHV